QDMSADAVDLLKQIADHPVLDRDAQLAARRWLDTEAKDYFPGRPRKASIAIRAEGRHAVFLSTDGVFTKNADGTPPADLQEQGSALFRAGKFIEDNFRKTNLFSQEGITQETKQAVF